MTALVCSVCGEAIEPGERLPWRHTKALRRKARPHLAGPAPRSGQPGAPDAEALTA